MFLETPAVRLHFERRGTGPNVLFVNGTGSDLRNLPNCFDLPLAETLNMCVYDHRGLGQSIPTDPSHQPTMADMAADSLEIVDSLGWDRFRVVGVSFGGMMAQEIALLAGSRVERLALVCTSSGGAGGSSYPLHEVYTLPRDEGIDVRVRITDLRTATDPQRAAALRTFMAAAPSAYPPSDGCCANSKRVGTTTRGNVSPSYVCRRLWPQGVTTASPPWRTARRSLSAFRGRASVCSMAVTGSSGKTPLRGP
jgi:pimeloyl-ACP methyl ester carboxylesterase